MLFILQGSHNWAVGGKKKALEKRLQTTLYE